MDEGEAEGGGGPLLELSMDTFLTVYRLLPHCLLLLIGISKTYTHVHVPYEHKCVYNMKVFKTNKN